MSDGGLKRIFPPPRRRPGLLTVLVRWRVEALVLLGIAAVYTEAGSTGLAVAGVALGVAAVVPPMRRTLMALVRAAVVSHRARSGLVQAGVTDRAGRPPWIVAFWPRGGGVLLSVWLRSGTTLDDVRAAAPLVAAACGASDVEVTDVPRRPDRVYLVVFRPRWGWPTMR